jgi:hypothetical protein
VLSNHCCRMWNNLRSKERLIRTQNPSKRGVHTQVNGDMLIDTNGNAIDETYSGFEFDLPTITSTEDVVSKFESRMNILTRNFYNI